MRLTAVLLLLGGTLFSVSALSAQTPIPRLITDEPNPADFEIAAEVAPPLFAQAQAVPQPEPPSAPSKASGDALDADSLAYREKIEQFGKRRHTFVHCELKNGKVLTGLVRDVAERGFEIKTGVLSGTFVRYSDLAKPPRQVPALGSRIRHGAEWTGLGVVFVALLPLAILLFPWAMAT